MRTTFLKFAVLALAVSAPGYGQVTPAAPAPPSRTIAPEARAARVPAPSGDLDVAFTPLDDLAADLNYDFRYNLDGVRDMAVDVRNMARDLRYNLDFESMPRFVTLRDLAPAAWAKGDPADSLYRVARESLNAGDYRKAAQLFALISQRYPNSQYRSDAYYWRAFALYRLGGLADLHEALLVIDSIPRSTVSGTAASGSTATGTAAIRAADDAQRFAVDAMNAARGMAISIRMDRPQNEAAILALRIRSALAARGDAAAAAQLARSADTGATSCDDEDAQLRIEALNALVQMDPKNAEPAVAKVMARRDPCSAALRRGALSLIARNNDLKSTDLLIHTAESDPDMGVRSESIRLLGRAPDDRSTAALTRFATTSGNPALQRIAVRALAAQNTPASRKAVRDIMARQDVSSDVRITALHYVGKTDMTVADLGRIYDGASDRSTRYEVVSLLGQRDEPAAADKLFDIARTSTDPSLRRNAIDALTRRKDPRTAKLLLDIIDK